MCCQPSSCVAHCLTTYLQLQVRVLKCLRCPLGRQRQLSRSAVHHVTDFHQSFEEARRLPPDTCISQSQDMQYVRWQRSRQAFIPGTYMQARGKQVDQPAAPRPQIPKLPCQSIPCSKLYRLAQPHLSRLVVGLDRACWCWNVEANQLAFQAVS
jgi:hypothetical protein